MYLGVEIALCDGGWTGRRERSEGCGASRDLNLGYMTQRVSVVGGQWGGCPGGRTMRRGG